MKFARVYAMIATAERHRSPQFKMAKKEGSSKSVKRKIEEVDDDASDGQSKSIKRFFGARKEGKRRLIYFTFGLVNFFSLFGFV